MRSSVVEEVGAFDERLKSGGDVEWCKRALGSGHSIRFREELTVEHPALSSLRAVSLRSRRIVGGHFMLARHEGGLRELLARKLWPRWKLALILSHSAGDRRQKVASLLVEFWLYWVRLSELGRLFVGGKPLR